MARRYSSASEFVLNKHRYIDKHGLSAVSLFSGGGVGDLGYLEAGFRFIIQSEKDGRRAALCQNNFPDTACIVGEVKATVTEIIDKYQSLTPKVLDLLCITPPCQGMSSSNSGRGKVSDPHSSDRRNILLLDSLPVISALKPRIIVVENVPQLLVRMVQFEGETGKLFDIFKKKINDNYELFSKVVQVADYGVPQDRKRAVLVAIRKDEVCLNFLQENNLLPLPISTHNKQGINGKSKWISLGDWLRHIKYMPLDAKSKNTTQDEKDLLHFVPHYVGDRYQMVADIPPNSGKSAYQNSKCHHCGKENVPDGLSYCPDCQSPMTNRPYVKEDNVYRLIKGFSSSYRRMYPDRPAATITTAGSHIGSDYKIHPWENRVLSIRESAEIQTIPRNYDWGLVFQKNHKYMARQVIGEALPPWFTYQHGIILAKLLLGKKIKPEELEALPSNFRKGD